MVRETVRLWLVRLAMVATVVGFLLLMFFSPRDSFSSSGMATLLGLEEYDLLISSAGFLLCAGGIGVISLLSRDD